MQSKSSRNIREILEQPACDHEGFVLNTRQIQFLWDLLISAERDEVLATADGDDVARQKAQARIKRIKAALDENGVFARRSRHDYPW